MDMTYKYILEELSQHADPIIRWKAVKIVTGSNPGVLDFSNPSGLFASSPIIHRLLSDQGADGRIPYHPYDKWFGAHWVLSILADFDYPRGDPSLKPLLEQCYAWLLSREHLSSIKTINGRTRRCASQEGNCVYYSLALGLADERTDELVTRLIKWQWEDGGWNCDKRPEAVNSSFNETLIPLRGLALYAKIKGDRSVVDAVNLAAEVFLKRHLFRRIRDNQIIDENFTRLHYPNYWHYDILFALKILSEAGYITDPRCTAGLDLLESKWLDEGGFPAEGKYYRVDNKKISGHSRVDWGGTSKIHANPFITLDALTVLKQAGRFEI
jgi:hypothetical protein